jgi:hypothetical protein
MAEEFRRTPQEVRDMQNDAEDWIAQGETDVSGMTYEEGVSYALRWVLGDSDDKPIENVYDGSEGSTEYTPGPKKEGRG